MFPKENKKSLWTLISTMVISVGAGHGVAPIGLIQIWTILGLENSDVIWTSPVLLFSIAQLFLVLSLFSKNRKKNSYYYIIGVLITITGIVSLTLIGLKDNNSAIPVFSHRFLLSPC